MENENSGKIQNEKNREVVGVVQEWNDGLDSSSGST